MSLYKNVLSFQYIFICFPNSTKEVSFRYLFLQQLSWYLFIFSFERVLHPWSPILHLRSGLVEFWTVPLTSWDFSSVFMWLIQCFLNEVLLSLLVCSHILEMYNFKWFSENDTCEEIWDLEFLENVVCNPHTWLVIWPGMTLYVQNKFSLRVSKALFHFHSPYSIATKKS